MRKNKRSLLGRLKVRTSLILVLAFFFVMLICGALLGIYSLHDNNKSLKNIVAEEETISLLDTSINEYLGVRSEMGKVLASVVVNSDLLVNDISSTWNDLGDDEDSSVVLSDDTQDLLVSARNQLSRAQMALDSLNKRIAENKEKYGYLSEVTVLYDLLINNKLPTSLESLTSGDVEKYYELQKEEIDPTEVMLENAYEQVKTKQSFSVMKAIDKEEQQFELVLLLVGIAMVASLIFAIACYIFLQKVVLRPLRDAGRHFDRIAAGDLTEDIAIRSSNEIGVLYSAMQRMQASLVDMVAGVRSGVGEIRIGSQQIFTGNTDLSSRTEQQAASLQQTAASMEEIASTVKQNADNAYKADELARSAAAVAQRGGDAVHSVADTMTGIRESSNKIAEIVSVIDSIAFQTNILALNAAVEAARAGEQGRGFAVVAGEVRALAQRSSNAAKDVRDLIDDTVARIQEGSTKVEDADKLMAEMVKAVEGVTTIMNEISSASNEQSEGINQINLAVTEMDSVVQQNAALVQQAASAAGSLQDQAEHLDKSVATFRLKDATGAEGALVIL